MVLNRIAPPIDTIIWSPSFNPVVNGSVNIAACITDDGEEHADDTHEKVADQTAACPRLSRNLDVAAGAEILIEDAVVMLRRRHGPWPKDLRPALRASTLGCDAGAPAIDRAGREATGTFHPPGATSLPDHQTHHHRRNLLPVLSCSPQRSIVRAALRSPLPSTPSPSEPPRSASADQTDQPRVSHTLRTAATPGQQWAVGL